MSLVISGSNLTWVGQFDGHQFDVLAPIDAIQAISSWLKNNFNLVINNYDFSQDFSSVTLYVVTNMDRGATGAPDDGAADIKANIDAAWMNQLTSSGTNGGQGLLSSSISTPIVNNDPQGASSSSYADTTSPGDFIQNLLPTWLGGQPVTPNQQAQRAAAAKAQIGAVGANATTISGAGSPSASTAVTVGTQQTLAAIADQNKLAVAANADAARSDSSSLNTYLWIGGAVAVVVVLAVLAPYLSAARG